MNWLGYARKWEGKNISVCRQERKEKADRLDRGSEIRIGEGKQGPLEYKPRGINTEQVISILFSSMVKLQVLSIRRRANETNAVDYGSVRT